LPGRPVTALSNRDDDPDPLAAAERNPYAQPDIRGRRIRGQIVEKPVERQVEGNAQDRHERVGFPGGRWMRQSLRRTAGMFAQAVDKIVDALRKPR
jgi:hypothetical protein